MQAFAGTDQGLCATKFGFGKLDFGSSECLVAGSLQCGHGFINLLEKCTCRVLMICG